MSVYMSGSFVMGYGMNHLSWAVGAS